jgi:hypothetical protein
VVRSQSTLQRLLRGEIKKKTPDSSCIHSFLHKFCLDKILKVIAKTLINKIYASEVK